MGRVLCYVFLLCLGTISPSGTGRCDTSADLEEGTTALWGEHDFVKALRLLRPLADSGNASAEEAIAFMYEKGWGVPRDDRLAVEWMLKSADQDNRDVMTSLGEMYRDGRAGPADYIHAYMWFRLALNRRTQNDLDFGAYPSRDRADIAKRMTVAQIAEAERLAAAWKPTSHCIDC